MINKREAGVFVIIVKTNSNTCNVSKIYNDINEILL